MQSELKKDEIILEVVCAGPKNYASFSTVLKSLILQVCGHYLKEKSLP